MAGNRIVVLVRNHWQDASLADVYTVHKGRVVEVQAFADRKPCAGLERKQSEIGEP